jgi:hypothetical protein
MSDNRRTDDDIAQTLEAATQEIRRLRALAYLGEHEFPDLTYRARLEELVPQHRALEAKLEAATLREQRLWEQLDVLHALAFQLDRFPNAVKLDTYAYGLIRDTRAAILKLSALLGDREK